MAYTNKRPLRLLHTSDLHIGNDISPEEALTGLDAALERGREAMVDAVLIAGDLFDHQRLPEATVVDVMQTLAAYGRPIVVLPGNHDTLLAQPRWFNDPPGEVTIIKGAEGELVIIEDLGLAVWGRPVYDHHPGFRPLEGMPPRPSEGWYVCIAHGLFIDSTDQFARSSPIFPEEIGEAGCDYIALGHVHAFRDVSQQGVPAFYSGAPSGIQHGAVALVEMDPEAGVTVTRLDIS